MAEIHLNLLSSKYYSLTTSKEDMESKYRESMFLYKTLNNYYSIELSKRNTLLNKKLSNWCLLNLVSLKWFINSRYWL